MCFYKSSKCIADKNSRNNMSNKDDENDRRCTEQNEYNVIREVTEAKVISRQNKNDNNRT